MEYLLVNIIDVFGVFYIVFNNVGIEGEYLCFIVEDIEWNLW